MDDEKVPEKDESEKKRRAKRIGLASALAVSALAALAIGCAVLLPGGDAASEPDKEQGVPAAAKASERQSAKVQAPSGRADEAEGRQAGQQAAEEDPATPATGDGAEGGVPAPASAAAGGAAAPQAAPSQEAAPGQATPSPVPEAPAVQAPTPAPEPEPPAPAPEPPAPAPAPDPPAPAPEKHICRTCGADITGGEAEHIKMHMLAGEDASWYPA